MIIYVYWSSLAALFCTNIAKQYWYIMIIYVLLARWWLFLSFLRLLETPSDDSKSGIGSTKSRLVQKRSNLPNPMRFKSWFAIFKLPSIEVNDHLLLDESVLFLVYPLYNIIYTHYIPTIAICSNKPKMITPARRQYQVTYPLTQVIKCSVFVPLHCCLLSSQSVQCLTCSACLWQCPVALYPTHQTEESQRWARRQSRYKCRSAD
jgi:hypothetical protein